LAKNVPRKGRCKNAKTSLPLEVLPTRIVFGSILIPIESPGSSPSNHALALKPSDDHISVLADEAAPSETVTGALLSGALAEPVLLQAGRKETNKMNARKAAVFLFSIDYPPNINCSFIFCPKKFNSILLYHNCGAIVV
jgi:hypothetical protein